MPDTKPHPIPTLADIQLPEEDANKPADINLNEDEGDEGVVGDSEEAKKEKEEAERKAAEEKAAKEEADKKAAEDANKTDEQKKAEEEAKAKEEQEKEKLTPFHEHPDWKKMQEENKELREKLAKNEGKIEALLSTSKATTEEKKQAIKTAEERLQEDLDNGWQPKSQLEIAERNNKYLREELKTREKVEKEEAEAEESTKKSEVEELSKKFTTAIDTTIAELKVSEADAAKIYTRVNEWRTSHLVSANPDNIGKILKMAHNELKNEGAIGAVEKTPEELRAEADAKAKVESEKTEAEKKKKEAEEAKKRANSRISRGNSGSGDQSGKKEKKPLSQLRRSLDSIVMDHRDDLDN